MKTAKQLFDKEQIAAIEATIAEVEKRTSGEVVPAVATASGRYDRAEDLFGLLLSLLTLAVCWSLFQGVTPSPSSWSGGETLNLNLWAILAIVIITFFIGIALATHFPILRLPLISKQEMQEEVERRARDTFQRLRVRGTVNATGILIYVSLYEHMVRVVGDDTIAEKLSEDDWQGVCDRIIEGFRNGAPDEGMRNGILRCGELLASHFPIEEGDINELPDTLHFID